MSALPTIGRRLSSMRVDDLDAVLAVEQAAYDFPWTRGNFIDSLHAGYACWLLRGARQQLLGYAVSMAGVDELHLLNLTVAPAEQGQGHARWLLDALVDHCRQQPAAMLWLEVRTGNTRARELYRRYGFSEIGVRRNYYPAPKGRREDAVVMSLATGAPLAQAPGSGQPWSPGGPDGLD
ncbi:MAG: ribosomal protein S18-alanine N-acetyltransferase [Ideonella sp.]|nr:ribosomal protein S18-alanine N-acetyltransferase [Ideonella sp.]